MIDRRIPWRPRFSLRTLAIVVTLSAVIVGWFTQSALRQRRAVAELTKLGADVLYEHRADRKSMSWYPEWLRDWLGVDFFAEATEVQFGFQYGWAEQSARNKVIRSQVVLSVRSQELSRSIENRLASRATIPPIPPLPLPSRMIEADAMLEIRRLPHLRKLTLIAATSAKAKATPWAYSSDEFVLDANNLQLLRDISTLEELVVEKMPADDKLLNALQGFRSLKRLRLGQASFSEQGTRHLESLTNLQVLTFADVGYFQPIPQGPLLPETLPASANLRELRIPNYTISNQSACCLPRLPKLEILDCGSIAVDDEGIRFFAALSQLRELSLVDSRITNSGAAHLAKLTELRRLALTNNRITDDGLRHLALLTKLESLYLAHLPVTDAGLAHLRGATAMHVLVLSGTKITDHGLIHLSEMSDLWSLDLSFTTITDDSIEPLLGFKKLTTLRLLGTRITQQGTGRLRQAFPAASIDLPDAADSPEVESPQASP